MVKKVLFNRCRASKSHRMNFTFHHQKIQTMHNFDRFASNQEQPAAEFGQGEFDNEYGQGEAPLNEMQELELANQLLAVTNEAEIGKWVGSLFRKLKGVGQNFAATDEGQQLRNTFRQGARNVLQQGIRSGMQFAGRSLSNNM